MGVQGGLGGESSGSGSATRARLPVHNCSGELRHICTDNRIRSDVICTTKVPYKTGTAVGSGSCGWGSYEAVTGRL